MNSPEVKAFIKERASLFWHIPENKKEEISHEFLVETILNYGQIDDVRKLFEIMSIEYVSQIFFKATKEKTRTNYFKPVMNFFTLYFERNAQGNSQKTSN